MALGSEPLAATAPPVRTWGAFRSSNYRLYLLGLVVSQVGTWMQYVAEGLLVYRLTHEPLSLGLVGFLPMLPLVPLMLVAGAWADRLPRKKLLLIVQVAAVFPPLALAAITWLGVVRVWHVIVVEVVMQALAAVDLPARHALIADTVEPADLDTAVAASASAFNLARVVGPALGGLLVAWGGEAVCFALNGASFLLVAAALLFMRVSPHRMSARQQSLKTNLKEGVFYILRERLLLATLLVSVAVGLLVMPYQRFLPIFALDVLDVGDWGLGVLNAAAGLGAVIGALALAWLLSAFPGRRGRWTLAIGLVLPLALAGFSRAHSFWLSAGLVTLVGAGVVAVRSLAFTLAQVHVQDSLRGRVMGMLTLASVSSIRVGELGVGIIAERAGQISLPLLLVAGAFLVCMAAAGVLLPGLRRAA